MNLKAAPDSLKTALRKIPHLVEVKSGTLGSYRFVQTAGGLKLVDHDGRSQLIPNYNGEKPLDFARTPGQEKHLIWAIERLTRLERIRYLEQHGEGTAKISISLLTGENFETVHNVDEQMRVKMRVGSAFKIRIKNDGETPMVAHIASFDSDGMVTILSERMKDKSHCPREKKHISKGQSAIFPGCLGTAYKWGTEPGENQLFVVFAPQYLTHFKRLELDFATVGQATRGSADLLINKNWGAKRLIVETK